MSADYFLDTNILVYSFDSSDKQKQQTAIHLIAKALRTGKGVISWQVVQEFMNVAMRQFKQPMPPGDAMLFLQNTLEPLCTIFPSSLLWRHALSIKMDSQYGWYDSLIVASALQSGARTLYSEDLQHGRTFGSLTLINPFLES